MSTQSCQLFSLEPRKVNRRLHGKANANSHGARPVRQIVSMMKWIRTSRLSIKNSLSRAQAGAPRAHRCGVYLTTCAAESRSECLRPVAYRLYIVYRPSLLGPVDPSFRALHGRLKLKQGDGGANTPISGSVWV